MVIEIVTGIVLLFTVASIVVPTLMTGAPPMPTSKAVWRAMKPLLPEKPEGAIVDLGSGWGGLAMRLARTYPDRPVIGYEMSPLPWLVSALRAKWGGPANLSFRFGDARRADLSGTGLIVVFLNREALESLRPGIERDARPGTFVVSNFFALQGWSPVAQAVADDPHRSPVYLYRVDHRDLAARTRTT